MDSKMTKIQRFNYGTILVLTTILIRELLNLKERNAPVLIQLFVFLVQYFSKTLL